MTSSRIQLVIRGQSVVTPDALGPAAIHVGGGVIRAVTSYDAPVPAGAAVIEAGDGVLMPGIVDSHVHVNEPGRTEWEGFASATRAAAAGGVTTIIDMPLNSIPATTSAAALTEKRTAAAARSRVDVGFWGGVVPGNVGELAGLHDAGVLGFKCFLVPSGVDEFPHVGERELRVAMPVLAELGAVLLVHAELPGPLERAHRTGGDPRSYEGYLHSRPPEAEHAAIAMMLRLCADFGTRIHIVHLSSAFAVDALRAARLDGLPVTVETCPHYLHFAAEDIPDGATAYKCAPPIRGRANREALWAALRANDIDLVASDHSPCPPAMKALEMGDFTRAWGGIASVELGLRIIWHGARKRGYSMRRVADWMCAGPARLAGLSHRKGLIAVGCDADLVLWHPDEPWRVDASALHHRHPVTPYDGEIMEGRIEMTMVRGQVVYQNGAFPGEPAGALLHRTAGA
jgi:allantoinase